MLMGFAAMTREAKDHNVVLGVRAKFRQSYFNSRPSGLRIRQKASATTERIREKRMKCDCIALRAA
jgi:pyridoxine/pyridoxamine 5'-phosphate oxidase